MKGTLAAIVLLALAACSNVPVVQPQPLQSTQSACANGAEASYACQVERYNAIGSF